MKTVIEMAGQAFETPGTESAFRNGFWTVTQDELERFAELVRADERKKVRAAMKKAHVRLLKNAIAAERNSWPSEMEAMERQINILTDALAQERDKWMERTAILIRGEREACAKVCENLPMQQEYDVRDQCAAAIRARSNT